MALINNNPYSPLPPPKANGGLTIGRQATGPWAAIPTIPEASWLTRQNLQSSAGVPIAALFQLQAGMRPGNNSGIQIPEIQHYVGDPRKNWGPFDSYCVPEVCETNFIRKPNEDCRLPTNHDHFLYNTSDDPENKWGHLSRKKTTYLQIM